METLGETSKGKRRVTSNTEMQVHGKANTSITEMLVSSGLKRRKITFKIILTLYSTLISYPDCALLLMVKISVVNTVHTHYVFVDKIKYSRALLLP